jgi:hypothetical protein
LFYDVFDAHFVLNSPKRYDILKIIIKNVIKQPEPVGAGPVRTGRGGAGAGSSRCRPEKFPEPPHCIMVNFEIKKINQGKFLGIFNFKAKYFSNKDLY